MNIAVREKLRKYLNEYNKVEKNSIFEKNYKTTRFRGLIMYFLYKENLRKNIKLTLSEIATIFNIKSHSTVIHSIQKTEKYIQKPLLLGKNERIKYTYLVYTFNKILNDLI
ncbi:hypothetical protein CCAND93_290017 [Capnocytophaga canis]|uniref:Chromosomal replication initiator DnaA C-terminal domain-containing protein n=1 Tax=Capnocytophaga canis TaxID=1848903 RepID=A0A0B7ILJ7_9FLAO|nr:hypothetical protein CCAND93_290017 [Capnocytophaga canis]